MNRDTRKGLDSTPDANRDPLTGTPGSHPVGTGIGAAAGGVAAGAAAGTLAAGPVGTVVGAAIGAVDGGWRQGSAEVSTRPWWEPWRGPHDASVLRKRHDDDEYKRVSARRDRVQEM